MTIVVQLGESMHHDDNYLEIRFFSVLDHTLVYLHRVALEGDNIVAEHIRGKYR